MEVHEANGEITIDQAIERGLVQIESVSEFSDVVINWHINASNIAAHALQGNYVHPDDENKIVIISVPAVDKEGNPVLDEEGKQTYRDLKDEEVDAFRAGLMYALEAFGELPFDYVLTDADNAPIHASDNAPLCNQSESQD